MRFSCSDLSCYPSIARAFSSGERVFLQNGWDVLAQRNNSPTNATLVKQSPFFTFWGVVRLL